MSSTFHSLNALLKNITINTILFEETHPPAFSCRVGKRGSLEVEREKNKVFGCLLGTKMREIIPEIKAQKSTNTIEHQLAIMLVRCAPLEDARPTYAGCWRDQ